MEVFNDAMAAAAGVAAAPDFLPGPLRPGVTLHSPALVGAYLVPGIEKKRTIVARMRTKQEAYPRPSDSAQAHIYDRIDGLLYAVEARTEEQHSNITRWVIDPLFEPDEMTSPETDSTEQRAVVAVLDPLNKLIQKVGLAGSPFLAINRDVFNEIRQAAGLPHLTFPDFIERYAAGLAGQQVRFFSD